MAFFTDKFLNDRREELLRSVDRFQYQLNGGAWQTGTVNSKEIIGTNVVVFVNVPNFGRWFCAARGLWPTGYSRKCRLKGACFRSRLDRAGKNLYCRGGGNATHGLERSLDETLSAGNDGDSKRLAGGVQFWLAD